MLLSPILVFSALNLNVCLGIPLWEGESVTIEPPIETTLRQEVLFDAVIQEGEDSFKYPTTPFPDPVGEGPTIPPDTPDDENDGNIKVVNGPVIVGNISCKCGTSVKTKIVGGEAVPISELPWTAALVRKRNSTQRGPYCGGTLISTFTVQQ